MHLKDEQHLAQNLKGGDAATVAVTVKAISLNGHADIVIMCMRGNKMLWLAKAN